MPIYIYVYTLIWDFLVWGKYVIIERIMFNCLVTVCYAVMMMCLFPKIQRHTCTQLRIYIIVRFTTKQDNTCAIIIIFMCLCIRCTTVFFTQHSSYKTMCIHVWYCCMGRSRILRESVRGSFVLDEFPNIRNYILHCTCMYTYVIMYLHVEHYTAAQKEAEKRQNSHDYTYIRTCTYLYIHVYTYVRTCMYVHIKYFYQWVRNMYSRGQKLVNTSF